LKALGDKLSELESSVAAAKDLEELRETVTEVIKAMKALQHGEVQEGN
jgi:predicted RNase H-like HicB family nuclease